MGAISSLIDIFEQASDLIILADSCGRILDANRSARRRLGYSRDELLALTLAGIDADSVGTTLLSVGLHSVNFKSKDGHEFPVEARVDVSPDLNRAPGLLLIARDIRERLLAEDRLQNQNLLLKNILANIPHAIYWKDKNLVYAGCNDNFARDVGLQNPEQLVGLTVHDLPQRSEEAILSQQCDREVLSKDFPLLDFEEQRLQDDGRIVTLLTSRVPLKDAAGLITGLLGIYTDVTERRLAEAALEKSENRHKKLSQEFQTVLNGISDSLMLLSPQLEVVWANKGTAAHLNCEFSEIAGSYCFQLWDHLSEPCRQCVALRSFHSGETEEAIRQDPDGRVWGIKAFPIKDNHGRVANVIHLASDITEKKRLREEADRAGKLASLGELSAGVAHEINNPNGLVLLNLPLLEDVFKDSLPILEAHYQSHGDFPLAGLSYLRMRAEVPRLFTELADGAQRIRQIVDDLKNFVQKVPSDQREPFDLNLSIEKVIRLASNNLQKSTEKFTCFYAEKLPLAVGNAQQIEQVLLNLLLNACHALPDRQRKIELSSGVDLERENLVVKLKDQGLGINPADLPNITNPFFTTRREQGGTGLGLSIAARIVKEHNGSLQFESVLGGGTTVTLTLPCGKG